MVLKITLDTNCLINVFDRDSLTATSIEALTDLIRQGLLHKADLAVTTRVESDLQRDRKIERRDEMLRYLKMLPIVPSLFRVGLSRVGDDAIPSEGDAAFARELQRVLFPGLDVTDKRYSNKMNDIDHLVGHHINKRDIFVTDDQGLLRKKEEMQASFALVVATPEECIRLVLSGHGGAYVEQSHVAEAAFEISFRRKNVRITSAHHDYQLVIGVTNRGSGVLRDYHLDVDFPTAVLSEGNPVVEAQSDRTASKIRFLGEGLADAIYPDDTLAWTVNYHMNGELYWRGSDLFEQWVRASLYANGRRYVVEDRFENLQIF